MEFVDKTHFELPHQLLKRFLDRCLLCTPYPKDLYEAMKSDVDEDTTINPTGKSTYKLLLEQILNDSHLGKNEKHGQGYCCYCMRTICSESSHSTLEHVIPNMTEDKNVFNSYYKVPTKLERDPKTMVFKNVFINRHHCEAPPFPHNVSYENLVASCDGSLPLGSTNHVCCNGPRSQQVIPPLMFISNIHSEIKYRRNGVVIWCENPDIEKRERHKVISEVLMLNCDILKMIRRIWAYLSEKGMGCQLSAEERRRVIDTLRSEMPLIEKDIIQNFDQDSYWNLLSEYTYFNDSTLFD